MKCRLCGRTPNEICIVLHRVNEKGIPGIWECRPICGAPTTTGDEQKYVYIFGLWPDETWGRKDMNDEHPKIPSAVFDLFRGDTMREMEFTPLEFVRFRHDVESFGLTLREISRVPYHDPEGVI